MTLCQQQYSRTQLYGLSQVSMVMLCRKEKLVSIQETPVPLNIWALSDGLCLQTISAMVMSCAVFSQHYVLWHRTTVARKNALINIWSSYMHA